MVIGVISDTHAMLRPEALDALSDSDLILHAGDIGAPFIIPALRELAPVVAIRGNVDEYEVWAREFPTTNVTEAAGLMFYMLHDRKQLDLDPQVSGFAAVISGHSHRPNIETRHGVLYFNPGSAGPRRFRLPVSLGRITMAGGKLRPEIITIG